MSFSERYLGSSRTLRLAPESKMISVILNSENKFLNKFEHDNCVCFEAN